MTPVSQATIAEQLQTEVERLHAFITAWFNGTEDHSRNHFDTQITDRLVQTFINIQPSGKALQRHHLTDGLFTGFGSNPDFEISIRDFELHHYDAGSGLAVATYAEHQRGAKNTNPPDNVRVSSVVFHCDATAGHAPVWVHLHETARTS